MTSEQVQVLDIVGQKRNTTVHGVVSLSPIKESAKNKEKKYFNAQIADDKKVVRMVSFDPKLWPNNIGTVERGPFKYRTRELRYPKS